MMLEESIAGFLMDDTAIGAYIEGRVYGQIAPSKSPLPRIVYSRISTRRTQTLCGTDTTARAVVQIDSYDKTYKGAHLLATAIRKTLTDFSGDMRGTRVSTVTMESDIDLDDPDPGLYRVSQTYFFWFTEE